MQDHNLLDAGAPRAVPLWRRAVLPLCVAALLGVFGVLADEVTEGSTLGFDMTILRALRNPSDPSNPIGPGWLVEAGRDVTSLGSTALLAILTVLVVLPLVFRGKRRTGWYLAVAVASGALVSTVLKLVFDRPRPDIQTSVEVFNASFPSGHATVSAVVYLTIGALLAGTTRHRGERVFYVSAAIALTVLVGLSRLYLGVHYPTDVLAGWLIGTAWAIICWVGARALLPGPPPAR